ncbi:MAG: 50S ribosomal protein L4 [Ruminococcus sp.]|jgi:large subunit ribosomal protein L4|nr:50S ribosomal protein L4 [Ruminococcus sp.]
MAKASVYNMAGEKIDTTELSDAVFGIAEENINHSVLHDAVVNYLANQRQGTQSTLTRTEVKGGGRKPWRQKGTGRARQGSTRSPQWVHGGVALGPKPRSYRYELNKKVKRLAMKTALSVKYLNNEVKVLDTITLDGYSTKAVVNMLSALEVTGKALIVLPESDAKIIKSASNIKGVKTTLAGTLNVYDILNYDKFIVVKSALAKIEEVYA